VRGPCLPRIFLAFLGDSLGALAVGPLACTAQSNATPGAADDGADGRGPAAAACASLASLASLCGSAARLLDCEGGERAADGAAAGAGGAAEDAGGGGAGGVARLAALLAHAAAVLRARAAAAVASLAPPPVPVPTAPLSALAAAAAAPSLAEHKLSAPAHARAHARAHAPALGFGARTTEAEHVDVDCTAASQGCWLPSARFEPLGRFAAVGGARCPPPTLGADQLARAERTPPAGDDALWLQAPAALLALVRTKHRLLLAADDDDESDGESDGEAGGAAALDAPSPGEAAACAQLRTLCAELDAAIANMATCVHAASEPLAPLTAAAPEQPGAVTVTVTASHRLRDEGGGRRSSAGEPERDDSAAAQVLREMAAELARVAVLSCRSLI
jgi:hypothetical protein